MQKTTYVLIADGARARLFVVEEGTADLKPALGQEFIGTNLPSREIGSDRPGRSFDSAGFGRHAMEPPTDPHRHAERVFAQEVSRTPDEETNSNIWSWSHPPKARAICAADSPMRCATE